MTLGVWLTYLVGLYVLWPVAYRYYYRESPYARRLPAWTTYEWVDAALGVSMAAFLMSLWTTPSSWSGSHGEWLGVILVGSASVLRIWSLASLGRNFRIGHKPDSTVEYVSRGPYRYMRHPINAGLILASVGLGWMTGFELRSLLLIGATVAYYWIQGTEEDRYWRAVTKEAAPEQPMVPVRRIPRCELVSPDTH